MDDSRDALIEEIVRKLAKVERRVDRLVKPEMAQRGGVAVYNNAAISVGTGAWAALTFNSERWDDAAFHSTVSNTSRLTVPTGYAGQYVIVGHGRFDYNAGGTQRTAGVRLNGATFLRVDTRDVTPPSHDVGCSTIYDLSAGDYVEFCVYQDSGGNLDILAAGNYSPEFRMVKV